jgi:succinate dehydrogenase / fumarate reductase cytochrome b subunit
MSNPNRPLSPHLQIYKPQLTSMLSIAHRLTGMLLSAGVVVFTIWLYLVTTNAAIADQLSAFFGHGIGQVILFGWLFTFNYHLCNGIRHLFWDAGKGYDIPTLYKSGFVVVVLAVLLTAGQLYWGYVA